MTIKIKYTAINSYIRHSATRGEQLGQLGQLDFLLQLGSLFVRSFVRSFVRISYLPTYTAGKVGTGTRLVRSDRYSLSLIQQAYVCARRLYRARAHIYIVDLLREPTSILL